MLKTIILETGTTLPGTEETLELLDMARASGFAKDMIVNSLHRVWLVADARKQLHGHRRLYTQALATLGATLPSKATY